MSQRHCRFDASRSLTRSDDLNAKRFETVESEWRLPKSSSGALEIVAAGVGPPRGGGPTECTHRRRGLRAVMPRRRRLRLGFRRKGGRSLQRRITCTADHLPPRAAGMSGFRRPFSVQSADSAVERRLYGIAPILNIQLFAIEVEDEQAGR